jgi:hypothetical protein
MNTESGTTRWWEYYLPRYLMPSVAGVVIVNWLCSYGGDGMRSLLLLPPRGTPIDATSLVLFLLYGNLFCYVASYPVLVFHATRVIDFSDGRWPARPLIDGYIITVVLIACVFWFRYVPPERRYWLAFITAFIVAAIQIRRLWIVLFPRFTARRGHDGSVSPAYLYAYAVARRRGIPETETKQGTTNRRDLWRKEFMDTYRHLREHGNSAFIFLLELALAALTYCVITTPGQSSAHQIGEVGLLFAIWAIPSAFVHLLAQHLERRFSRYEQIYGRSPGIR